MKKPWRGLIIIKQSYGKENTTKRNTKTKNDKQLKNEVQNDFMKKDYGLVQNFNFIKLRLNTKFLL